MVETTFADELKNIGKRASNLLDFTILDNVCYGKLPGDRHIVKIEFHDDAVRNEYNSIRITVMHKTHGFIDSVTLNMSRILNISEENGHFYMERCSRIGKIFWNTRTLTADEYDTLAEMSQLLRSQSFGACEKQALVVYSKFLENYVIYVIIPTNVSLVCSTMKAL